MTSLFHRERQEIERLHRDEKYRKETLHELKERADVRKELHTIARLRKEEHHNNWFTDRPEPVKPHHKSSRSKTTPRGRSYGSPTPKIFFK